ncbi:unnamed protein product [Arctogadus glacialis]
MNWSVPAGQTLSPGPRELRGGDNNRFTGGSRRGELEFICRNTFDHPYPTTKLCGSRTPRGFYPTCWPRAGTTCASGGTSSIDTLHLWGLETGQWYDICLQAAPVGGRDMFAPRGRRRLRAHVRPASPVSTATIIYESND